MLYICSFVFCHTARCTIVKRFCFFRFFALFQSETNFSFYNLKFFYNFLVYIIFVHQHVFLEKSKFWHLDIMGGTGQMKWQVLFKDFWGKLNEIECLRFDFLHVYAMHTIQIHSAAPWMGNLVIFLSCSIENKQRVRKIPID